MSPESETESSIQPMVLDEGGLAKQIIFDEYLESAEFNLMASSRTAQGVIDTSASVDKAEKMNMELGSDEIAKQARDNFREALTIAYKAKNRTFTSPQELRDLIENIGRTINKNLVKENILIRSGHDSEKYHYTKVADLEASMDQLYQELFERLQNPGQDPVELSAWLIYRINFVDHIFADGCGKASLVVSSWALMRSNHPLPKYRSRDEFFDNAPNIQKGLDPELDQIKYDHWVSYYRSLFDKN